MLSENRLIPFDANVGVVATVTSVKSCGVSGNRLIPFDANVEGAAIVSSFKSCGVSGNRLIPFDTNVGGAVVISSVKWVAHRVHTPYVSVPCSINNAISALLAL